MGADASKACIVDPRRAAIAPTTASGPAARQEGPLSSTGGSNNNNSSFRFSRTSSAGAGASSANQNGLVGMLLKGSRDQITAKMLANEANKPICVQLLPTDQRLWVLPLHVAAAIPDTPLHLLQDILMAYPKALYKHTTLTEEKLKRLTEEMESGSDERSTSSFGSFVSHTSTGDNSVHSLLSGVSLGSAGGGGGSFRGFPGSEESPSATKGFGSGWLPLHIAVWYGASIDILRYLIGKAPSTVYCKTSQGYLPLHLACGTEQPSDVHVLALVDAFPASIYVPTSDNAMAVDLLQFQQYYNHNSSGNPNDDGVDNDGGYHHHQRTQTPRQARRERVIRDALTGSNSDSSRYDPYPRCEQSIPPSRSLQIPVKAKRPFLFKNLRKKKSDSMAFRTTKLFLALTSGDWQSAEERLVKRPKEAGIWTLSMEDMDPPCHMLPLHVALRRGAPPPLAKHLLDSYPEGVFCREFYGMLPLHIACHAGASVDVAGLLRRRYPDAAAMRDVSGMLPLHLACSSEACHVSLVLFLLESYPAGMYQQDSKGCLPSDYLEHSGHPQQALLQAAFQRGESFWSAREVEPDSLVYYIGRRNWKKALAALERNPEEASQWTKHPHTGARYLPLQFGCKYKAPSALMKALIDSYPEGLSAPSQEHDMLALHLACQHGCSPDSIKFLLDGYAEAAFIKDAHGLLPLHLACTEGTSVHVVKALVDTNPKACTTADERGMTPRTYAEASVHPHSKKVLRLLNEIDAR